MQDKLKSLEIKYSIEWQEFNLEKLFGKSTRGKRLKKSDRIIGDLPFVTAGEADTGISSYIGNSVEIFDKNTITIDMFGSAKYRGYKYGADDHISVIHTECLPREVVIFIATAINKSSNTGEFDYSKNFYPRDADVLNISLPATNGKINYSFMLDCIQTLEAERIQTLEAYLVAAGLKDYEFTEKEEKVLSEFKNDGGIQWKEFEFQDLFDHIEQGSRLKKKDQIEGDLPFVMSGTTNQGVASYISNDVKVFQSNSITIDIFGNAFYRNYEYGMGDDTGSYWNEKKIDKLSMLFITTMVNKLLSGRYDYGHKLRSSRTYRFKLKLPSRNGKPDYEFMNTFIVLVQKNVIKNLVEWADKKIELTKKVI